MASFINVCPFTVSKTTRELQLYWSSSHQAVSISQDLKMPQFTIEKVSSTVCNEQFHLGNYRFAHKHYLDWLIEFRNKKCSVPTDAVVIIQHHRCISVKGKYKVSSLVGVRSNLSIPGNLQLPCGPVSHEAISELSFDSKLLAIHSNCRYIVGQFLDGFGQCTWKNKLGSHHTIGCVITSRTR